MINPKLIILRFFVILIFSILSSASPLKGLFAQPVGWTEPPCKDNQVLDEYCSNWLTDPETGNGVCAPDGRVEICVSVVNNPSDLDNLSNVQRCMRDGTVCVDDTPMKLINSIEVYLSEIGGCWEYRRDYTCSTNVMIDTCQELRDNAECSVFTRQCIDSDEIFGCLEYELSYQCLIEKGSSREVEFCGDTNVCVGGICWDTSYPPDQDFAQVVTDMEIARQVGVYSPEGLDIFSGTSDVCRSKRAAGLKNCCGTSTKGQGKSNNAMMGEFLAGAGGYAVRAGSKYVFDSLYGDTINWLSSGMSAAIGGMPGGTSFLDSIANPSFSYFGFSIGGTGQFLGTTGYQLIGPSGGFPGMYFNPYAFAAAIAIQVIMEAMTCSEEEAMLGMKRGAGLCSPKIGDWCDKEVLGVCITRKQSYCCYNSKFARLINVEGRKQLGMGWGNTKSPSCNGFTASQLAEIDFSRIDMTELINDVMKAVDTSFLNLDRANAGSNLEDHADKVLRDSCAKVASKPNLQLPPECEGVL